MVLECREEMERRLAKGRFMFKGKKGIRKELSDIGPQMCDNQKIAVDLLTTSAK